jgi:flagellar export protein FliJ
MVNPNRQKIELWETLAEKINAELIIVQKQFNEVHKKRQYMAAEGDRLRQMKLQYAEDLSRIQSREHDINSATHIRNFMAHLDHTVASVDREVTDLQTLESKIRRRLLELNKEQQKYSKLRDRAELQARRTSERAEQKNQDMMSILRYEVKAL